jgi:acyl-coenzyme A thioesterase PaaI-like protein
MARSDYAGILDRHCGKGEVLAGGVLRPELTDRQPGGSCGTALVHPAMMHGNRWPALYGGFFFDLARRAGALATQAESDAGRVAEPITLEIHFLRAVGRADVPDPGGLAIQWRARVDRLAGGESDRFAVVLEIGAEGSLYAYANALFAVGAARAGAEEVSENLVLPAHDPGWRAGWVAGRCMEKPGSLSAVFDTMLAKAAATVRGDGCPDTHEEHFLARTLAYTWIRPVENERARFEARVVQRGKRIALVTADIFVNGLTVGRGSGTVVFQQVAR